jgi:hypothetical protein
MVRCTWDRSDDQAAEQTAHPTAVRPGGSYRHSRMAIKLARFSSDDGANR